MFRLQLSHQRLAGCIRLGLQPVQHIGPHAFEGILAGSPVPRRPHFRHVSRAYLALLPQTGNLAKNSSRLSLLAVSRTFGVVVATRADWASRILFSNSTGSNVDRRSFNSSFSSAPIASCPIKRADVEYVRILYLATTAMETNVDSALSLLLEAGQPFEYAEVRDLAEPKPPEAPVLVLSGKPDLKICDGLLVGSLAGSGMCG